MSSAFPPASPVRGLYGITPEWDDIDRLVDGITSAFRGGMQVLQFRRKLASGDRKLAEARRLKDLCDRLGIVYIINDDWRLALDVGATGVHLGRDDGDLAPVRAQVGQGMLIGASCYNELALAESAVREGADHVAFGAVFTSPTKPLAVRAPLSCLTAARDLRLPPNGADARRPAVVAIGGITPENAPSVVAAGADALAVISALFETDDIEATARAFSRAFASSASTPI